MAPRHYCTHREILVRDVLSFSPSRNISPGVCFSLSLISSFVASGSSYSFKSWKCLRNCRQPRDGPLVLQHRKKEGVAKLSYLGDAKQAQRAFSIMRMICSLSPLQLVASHGYKELHFFQFHLGPVRADIDLGIRET